MKNLQKIWGKLLFIASIVIGANSHLIANECATKLFSVTIDSQLSIGDVVDNLADTCQLTVMIEDAAAKERMKKKLYYVKLKNSTLHGFLNTILKDNDLNYTLEGNKLTISYLITRTFRIHYITGGRNAKSTASITIANSQNAATSGGSLSSSKTGISINSDNKFTFWKSVKKEIQSILVGAADGDTGFVKKGKSWTGPNGKAWDHDPFEPIINPEAGMVTVTGTQKQINRVAKYIKILTNQLKSQVLIDVNILSVSFDNSTTTGVNWSELYSLQNLAINTFADARKNITGYKWDSETGITNVDGGIVPADQRTAQVISMTGHVKVSDVVKFLSTQGDVKAISSPRLMTLNNQPALISVGKELFYKIKSSSTASGGGGSVAAEGELVDSVFAGILLDITPEIDPNGYVTLKINPSISDTVNDVTTTSAVRTIPPDLTRRQIASVIKVKDGEHAILGGLISSKTGFKNNKIPLLGDMPLIGNMFKRKEKINKVEELVLIITPHIVKTSRSVSLKDLGYTKLNEK